MTKEKIKINFFLKIIYENIKKHKIHKKHKKPYSVD